MNATQLETAVELQRKAYGLLLWLKQRARTNPALFRPDEVAALASGETCAEWTGRRLASFPHEFRPADGQLRAFGFVLSSFLNTSFRIAESRQWDTAETTLVVGAATFRGRRHKQHATRRQQQVAEELCGLALGALADEHGLTVSAEQAEQALAATELSRDLRLWTYGCELVRRAEFASQGAAVHRLWLELEERDRKALSADSIWKARGRLLKWLNDQQA